MKKFLIIIFLIFFSQNLFSHTHITIRKPVTIFYENDKIQDLIDVAIIDVTSEIINSNNPFIKQLLIDNYVKKVCDYMTSNGLKIPVTPPLYIPSVNNPQMLFGVPIMDFQKSHAFYSYPSWYTKPTDYEGTRMIEIIDNIFENEAINLNEASVVALPIKLQFQINEFSIGNKKRYYLHILMIDPVKYLKNFFNPQKNLVNLFVNEKNKIINFIKEALTNEQNVSFPLIKAKFSKKVNYSPLILISHIHNQNIDNFIEKFLKTPDILTTLDNGSKVRFIPHNPNEANFPYNYNQEYLNPEQTEITGILSFCRFILPAKNIWLSFFPETTKINYVSMIMLMQKMNMQDFNPPKSEPMEFMIKNSLVHIYARYFPDNQTDEKYITFKYTTHDSRKIYVLSIFDPYIATSLLTAGQWHKPFSYINVYFYEFPDGSIGIFAKNPVYFIEKYYSDVTNEAFQLISEKWNSSPTTMFHFPQMTKHEMAEFMLNKLIRLINTTLDKMGVER